MEGGIVRREFRAGGAVEQLLLCCMLALTVQIGQPAVRDHHHTVEKQLCRCLLTSLDRVPTSRLAMTRELMARMPGVRREAVTEAADRLQRAGAINYKRGSIEVPDRRKLEAMACECHAVVRPEFPRLLPSRGH